MYARLENSLAPFVLRNYAAHKNLYENRSYSALHCLCQETIGTVIDINSIGFCKSLLLIL